MLCLFNNCFKLILCKLRGKLCFKNTFWNICLFTVYYEIS